MLTRIWLLLCKDQMQERDWNAFMTRGIYKLGYLCTWACVHRSPGGTPVMPKKRNPEEFMAYFNQVLIEKFANTRRSPSPLIQSPVSNFDNTINDWTWLWFCTKFTLLLKCNWNLKFDHEIFIMIKVYAVRSVWWPWSITVSGWKLRWWSSSPLFCFLTSVFTW